MTSETPNGTCPSCGRYVGPAEGCPYCGARLRARASIRAIKIVATLLATVGLGALWLAARHAEIPLVRVSQIEATMNMAYVRLDGRCTRSPSYDPESGYLSFWIEDGSGELYVSAYRAETRQIVEGGRVPALGDRVEVAGTLRVREGFPSLTIRSPEQLSITRAEPVDRQIGAIKPEDQFQRMRVRGQVRGVYEPYEGLVLVTLRDETGSIVVAVSKDVIALSQSSLASVTAEGQPVEVVAAVSLYEGTPQLVPAAVDDIVPLDEPAPVPVASRIGELGAGETGRWTLVRGTITGRDPFSDGLKLRLDDGSGEIVLLLWQSVAETIPKLEAFEVGAQVQAQGKLAEYRGELEVIPEIAGDVRLLAAAPPPQPTSTPSPPTPSSIPSPIPSLTDIPTLESTSLPTGTSSPTVPATPQESALTPEPSPTPPVPVTPIGEVGADWVGREVTVEGEVVAAASFSAGFKLTLADPSGQVVLLMWHDVYDDCWDAPQINVGAQVRASGTVDLYEGELQVQPTFGGDVKAIEGAVAWATPRDIGSLTPDDAGQRVMIEGEVVRVEGQSSAVKVFVSDGTGEVILFVWRNVLDRIAGNTGLGTPGSRVRAVGEVTVYRNNLELIPALPTDVTVLAME
jgi:DNA/RNA endonuclease YhcR with UshA esterase domain